MVDLSSLRLGSMISSSTGRRSVIAVMKKHRAMTKVTFFIASEFLFEMSMKVFEICV